MTNSEFMMLVTHAFDNDHYELLDQGISEYATMCYDHPHKKLPKFPDEVFEFLKDISSRPAFLASKAAFCLLMIYQYEWSRFSSQQRDELKIVLQAVYRRCQDGMGCFVITEVFGRFLDEAAGIAFFSEFSHHPDPLRRAYVPHGIGALLKKTKNSHYRQAAFQILDKLAMDQSEDVITEVAIVRAKYSVQ